MEADQPGPFRRALCLPTHHFLQPSLSPHHFSLPRPPSLTAILSCLFIKKNSGVTVEERMEQDRRQDRNAEAFFIFIQTHFSFQWTVVSGTCVYCMVNSVSFAFASYHHHLLRHSEIWTVSRSGLGLDGWVSSLLLAFCAIMGSTLLWPSFPICPSLRSMPMVPSLTFPTFLVCLAGPFSFLPSAPAPFTSCAPFPLPPHPASSPTPPLPLCLFLLCSSYSPIYSPDPLSPPSSFSFLGSLPATDIVIVRRVDYLLFLDPAPCTVVCPSVTVPLSSIILIFWFLLSPRFSSPLYMCI